MKHSYRMVHGYGQVTVNCAEEALEDTKKLLKEKGHSWQLRYNEANHTYSFDIPVAVLMDMSTVRPA